jgi:3-dehydroquinate dehydratase type I
MSLSKKHEHICGVVASQTIKEALTIMKKYNFLKFIEIRADYFNNPIEALRDLSGEKIDLKTKYIFTYRFTESQSSHNFVEQVYTEIIKLKPAFVDIEYNYLKKNPSFLNLCEKYQVNLIISTHLNNTPEIIHLKQIYGDIRDIAASCIKKIVTTAYCLEDNFTILNFLKSSPENDLISFSMNPVGRLSRLLCTFHGSLITYVTLSNTKVAPGIFTLEEHEEVISKLCLYQ